MRPFSGAILTADVVQFAKHQVAQVRRCCDIEAHGSKHFRFGIIAGVRRRFLRRRQWRSRRKTGRFTVERAVAAARPSSP